MCTKLILGRYDCANRIPKFSVIYEMQKCRNTLHSGQFTSQNCAKSGEMHDFGKYFAIQEGAHIPGAQSLGDLLTNAGDPKGTAHVWLNGHLFEAGRGTSSAFPSGTGVAHTVMNRSQNIVEILGVGDPSRDGDKIFYPLHPKRNEEMKGKGFFWKDPGLPIGSDPQKP